MSTPNPVNPTPESAWCKFEVGHFKRKLPLFYEISHAKPSMQLAIILGILAVITPLVLYSLRLSYTLKSDREFFRGTHTLGARELFDTLAASWLMLGNVFLTCLVLGRYYGVHNWWLILTWLFAFLLMMKHVGSISNALISHDTLHSFLSTSFNSRAIRVMAALITAATGIGIIALEIIVVMALIVPVTGNNASWLPFVGGFAILLTLALYSVLGGFTAVTDTDSKQLKWVFVGLVCVILVVLRALAGGIFETKDALAISTPTFASSGTIPIWFFAGLFFLQVPLFLGDFGTWQRIKACSASDVAAQRKVFGILGYANAIAWAILVVAGIALAAIPAGKLTAYPDSYLYATAGPIVDLVTLSTLPGQIGGPVIGTIFVFLLVVGLVCAMMSTADSYLLIAIQAFYDDILPSKPTTTPSVDSTAGIRFARFFSFVAVMLSFAIAVYVVVKKANFLPVVSLLFSLQATLAPLAVLALYHKKPERFRTTAILSLTATSFACIGYGLWAVFSKAAAGTPHQVNVTFVLPVAAFVIPFVILGIHVAIADKGAVFKWMRSFVVGNNSASETSSVK